MEELKIQPSALRIFEAIGTKFTLSIKPLTQNSKLVWTVHVQLPETQEEAVIATARNEIRVFRDVNTIISTLGKYTSKLSLFQLDVQENTRSLSNE